MRARASEIQNASATAVSVEPRSVRTSGRAVIARRTKRPIALIIVRNTIQRRVRSAGVAAVSLIEGITNCGWGPGFGPTANVNTPRTGWPSTEITRQKTRYQPSGTWRIGWTSWSGFAGDRVGRPVVTWWPPASVTAPLPNFGLTGAL